MSKGKESVKQSYIFNKNQLKNKQKGKVTDGGAKKVGILNQKPINDYRKYMFRSN